MLGTNFLQLVYKTKNDIKLNIFRANKASLGENYKMTPFNQLFSNYCSTTGSISLAYELVCLFLRRIFEMKDSKLTKIYCKKQHKSNSLEEIILPTRLNNQEKSPYD